jgi:hypothetical protein
MDWAWIGVGVSKPSSDTARTSSGAKPRFSNVVIFCSKDFRLEFFNWQYDVKPEVKNSPRRLNFTAKVQRNPHIIKK